MFRNVTLKCLTEIAAIQAQQYSSMFVDLFEHTIAKLKQVCTRCVLFEYSIQVYFV